MRRMIGLLTLCVGLSCGKKKEELPVDVDVSGIAAQLSDYERWGADLTSVREGFVTDECDDTLFTGLRASFVATVNLQLAESAPGEWHRRRLTLPECFPGHSASMVSRDMLLGVAWWAWRTDRKDVARDVVLYADAHGGVMGPGEPSRTAIRAPLYGTFAKIAGLTRVETHVPVTVSGAETGYERHVAAWHLHLRARLNGGMEDGYHWWLRKQADTQPSNALYAFLAARYVTGDYAPVVAALQDARHWPRDRLPSSAEHCTPWLWEQEEGSTSWSPCQESGEPAPVVTWTGSEWAVVARMLLDAAGAD